MGAVEHVQNVSRMSLRVVGHVQNVFRTDLGVVEHVKNAFSTCLLGVVELVQNTSFDVFEHTLSDPGQILYAVDHSYTRPGRV